LSSFGGGGSRRAGSTFEWGGGAHSSQESLKTRGPEGENGRKLVSVKILLESVMMDVIILLRGGGIQPGWKKEGGYDGGDNNSDNYAI